MKKVLLGMSGGIDSTYAVHLLKEKAAGVFPAAFPLYAMSYSQPLLISENGRSAGASAITLRAEA